MAHATSLAFAVQLLWSPVIGSALQMSHFKVISGERVTVSSETRYADSIAKCAAYCSIFRESGNSCLSVTYNSGSKQCQLSKDDSVTDVNDVSITTLMLIYSKCPTPSEPSNGFVLVNANVATYSCAEGYALTGDVNRMCVDGSWSGATPTCEIDCGIISYTNVEVPSSCTFVGCAVTLTKCVDGFRPETVSDFPVTVTCLSTGSWDAPTNVPSCPYELMFRGTADNDYDIMAAYLHNSAAEGATTDPACMDVHNMACTGHYRNPKLDTWENLGISRVLYELYLDGSTVMSVLLNGTGTLKTNWLDSDNGVLTRAISWPWTHLKSSDTSWWSLLGEVAEGRSFRILKHYYYCDDWYFSVVLFEPTYDCSYENHTSWPKFLYTLQTYATNFNVDEYGQATSLAVWVK